MWKSKNTDTPSSQAYSQLLANTTTNGREYAIAGLRPAMRRDNLRRVTGPQELPENSFIATSELNAKPPPQPIEILIVPMVILIGIGLIVMFLLTWWIRQVCQRPHLATLQLVSSAKSTPMVRTPRNLEDLLAVPRDMRQMPIAERRMQNGTHDEWAEPHSFEYYGSPSYVADSRYDLNEDHRGKEGKGDFRSYIPSYVTEDMRDDYRGDQRKPDSQYRTHEPSYVTEALSEDYDEDNRTVEPQYRSREQLSSPFTINVVPVSTIGPESTRGGSQQFPTTPNLLSPISNSSHRQEDTTSSSNTHEPPPPHARSGPSWYPSSSSALSDLMQEAASLRARLQYVEAQVQSPGTSREEMIKCPMCKLTMWKPYYITECGHSMCESCLQSSLWTSMDCPICHGRIETPPVENFYLKGLAEEVAGHGRLAPVDEEEENRVTRAWAALFPSSSS